MLFHLLILGGTLVWGLYRRPQRSEETSGEALALVRLGEPKPEGERQSFLAAFDDKYQAFVHNTLDRFLGIRHEKHLEALGGATGTDAIPPLVKRRNRQAGASVVVLGLVLTGTPLLVLSGIALSLGLSFGLMRITMKDMAEKRRLTARGLDMICYLTMLVGGYPALQSIGLILVFFSEKLIATVQGGASHELLVNVFAEVPQTVSLVERGKVVERPLATVEVGDVVVVYAGEVIPVDGEILSGYATIDQHALTGEALPMEKEAGDPVFASTLVITGEIRVTVLKSSSEMLAARITDILNRTRGHNTKVALRGVEIADKMVYTKLGLGLLAYPYWGMSTTLAVWTAGLGSLLMGTTSLSLMTHLDLAARNDILVKDGRSLELVGDVDTVVFDKTGTLTLQQLDVVDVTLCGELDEDELLALAAAMERRQSHLIAVAIRQAAETRGLTLPEVDETRIEVGYGLAVKLADGQREGQRVLLGSRRFLALNGVSLPQSMQELTDERQALGHSMVYLALGGALQGMIELQPVVRPEVRAVTSSLRDDDVELIMITGDQEAPARALAASLGIDRVFANALPEQKAELVAELQAQGRSVMFIGDGINDGIALKEAHVSVSITGATGVATDSAQVVLMDGTLEPLPKLFDLSERYERNLQTQYFLGVKVPAASIGGILAFGWGVGTSYLITFLTLFASIGVAWWPSAKSRREQTETERDAKG